MDIANDDVLKFLENRRVAVLCVELKDGSPHGATVHFSHQANPTKFYFLTDKKYRKSEALLEKPVRASVVVGFDENDMQTFQADGIVRTLSGEEDMAAFRKVHFAKLPDAQKWESDPDSIFLEFTPDWWQYTDYNAKPKLRISSQL